MATITYFGQEYTVPCDGYVYTDIKTGVTFLQPIHNLTKEITIGVNATAKNNLSNRRRVLDLLNAGETFPIQERLWECSLSGSAIIASDTEPTLDELRRYMGYGVIFEECATKAVEITMVVKPVTSVDEIPEEFRSRVPLGDTVIADLTAYPSRNLTAQEIIERILKETSVSEAQSCHNPGMNENKIGENDEY